MGIDTDSQIDKGEEGDGIIFVSTVDQAIDIGSSHNRKVSL